MYKEGHLVNSKHLNSEESLSNHYQVIVWTRFENQSHCYSHNAQCTTLKTTPSISTTNFKASLQKNWSVPDWTKRYKLYNKLPVFENCGSQDILIDWQVMKALKVTKTGENLNVAIIKIKRFGALCISG